MSDNKRVYIIEDDGPVRDSIVAVLRSTAAECLCFDTAEAFLTQCDALPDSNLCVVADVRLPGMSGIELLERLIAKGMSIPFVIITGHGEPEMVERLSPLEHVWFLEKPFDPASMLACIDRAVG